MGELRRELSFSGQALKRMSVVERVLRRSSIIPRYRNFCSGSRCVGMLLAIVAVLYHYLEAYTKRWTRPIVHCISEHRYICADI